MSPSPVVEHSGRARGVLIESGRRPDRAPVTTLGSIAVHVACVALAVHAAAGPMAGRVGLRPAAEHVVTVSLDRRSPPPAPPAPPVRTTTRAPGPTAAPPENHSPLIRLDITPTAAPVILSAIPESVTTTVARELAAQGTANVPAGDGDGAPPVYGAEDVELTAVLVDGQFGPRYPDELRATHPNGSVLARFVIDTTGRVEMPSVRIVMTSERDFGDAVRAALPRLRFTPARFRGRKVRVRVEQLFQFGCSC